MRARIKMILQAAAGLVVTGGLALSIALNQAGQAEDLTCKELSVYAKAGDQDWIYLADSTLTNVNGYFNLSDCSAGTMGANVVDSFVEDYGGSWCRVGISFTAPAAANTWLWGDQVEANDHPSSYIIPTTTGTVQKESQMTRPSLCRGTQYPAQTGQW